MVVTDHSRDPPLAGQVAKRRLRMTAKPCTLSAFILNLRLSPGDGRNAEASVDRRDGVAARMGELLKTPFVLTLRQAQD